MEIIFYRYGNICEPDIIKAFEACGITVIEESTEIYQKSIAGNKRIQLLSKLILTHHPAFVFSINFYPYISEICERLQIYYVCLSVDCPVLELFSVSIRNTCNRIFLFDYIQYERFHRENPDCIFYLPLATNVDRWDRVLSESTQGDIDTYANDISFVGSLYTEKSPLSHLSLDSFQQGYIDGIVNAQLQIMGCNFLEDVLTDSVINAVKQADPTFYSLEDSIGRTDAYVAANYYLGMYASALDRQRTLQELGTYFPVDVYTRSDTTVFKNISNIRCHGGVSTHIEMPKIFHYSKINLNMTIKSIQSGLSQRIWDVLGCGGFLITNFQNEIPDYFEIGSDLECYENLTDLKEKVQYYLIHDDIRRTIADHGYQKVKTCYTYIHRVAQIIKTVFALNT